MKTMRFIKNSIPLIAVIALVGVFTSPSPSQAPPSGDAQLATMKQYCAGCHSEKLKTAGISFEGITAATIPQDPDRFEKAVRKLRGHVMPPPGAPQPDAKAIDSLVAYLETSLDKTPEPEHITDQLVLHRLNRKEYQNAVRDLLL
ncbi:MAG: c-type cytochrome, partial [Acidobacteriota bacterium]